MVMMIKRILPLAGILLLSIVTKAQDNKYGIWYEADANFKIVKSLKAEIAGCLRTDENASNIESYYFEGGLKYKVNKYFSAGAYYRLIENKEKDSSFYARHRWFIQLNGEVPIGRFNISARYRFQEQIKTFIKDPEDEEPGFYNRFKLKLDYDVPGIPLEPFISAEAFSETFASNGIFVEKTRFSGGITYNINKKHAVTLEYIYQTSEVTKPHYFNIFALNYSFKQ